MSISNFSINGSRINSTLYKGKSRDFSFLIDEPHELGGQDLAANPVEYLLAALRRLPQCCHKSCGKRTWTSKLTTSTLTYNGILMRLNF